MKAAKLFILVTLFLLFGKGNVSAQWSKIGFDGKTITSVSTNQVNGNIFVVVDSILYRTANNGVDWEKISNGLNQLYILKVQVDIDEKIYVGTNSGIYFSIDNGVSFQSLNGNLPNDFGLYPAVSSICCLNSSIFIGTSAGVYKSNKNDFSWTLFNNNLPLEEANRIMLFFNNHLYIAMNSGIYTSLVDTNNWTKCFSGKVNDIAVVGNDLYAGTSTGCPPVKKTSDFGETWIDGSPAEDQCNGLSVLSFGNSIWVGTFYGSGIYSTDSGKSWANLNIGAWTTITSLSRRGTSLLAGTEYYSYNAGSGGLYIKSDVFENIKEILPYPEFITKPSSFKNDTTVSLSTPENTTIYYTEDGTLPTKLAKKYTDPILLNSSKTINVIAINENGDQSKINTGRFNLSSSPQGISSVMLSNFCMYPNPCSTILNVESDNPHSELVISIINSLGKLIRSSSFNDGETKIIFNIENLATGIYFFKIQSGQKTEMKIFSKN